MSILLLGANGQVGSAIQVFAKQHKIELLAFSRQELDFTNEPMLQEAFAKHQPKFVINAAAYTAVDLAETEQEAAMQLNGHALVALAKLCAEHNCVLIHLSTDYVFDGKSNRAYLEI